MRSSFCNMRPFSGARRRVPRMRKVRPSYLTFRTLESSFRRRANVAVLTLSPNTAVKSTAPSRSRGRPERFRARRPHLIRNSRSLSFGGACRGRLSSETADSSTLARVSRSSAITGSLRPSDGGQGGAKILFRTLASSTRTGLPSWSRTGLKFSSMRTILSGPTFNPNTLRIPSAVCRDWSASRAMAASLPCHATKPAARGSSWRKPSKPQRS